MMAKGSELKLIPDLEQQCEGLDLRLTLAAIKALRAALNPAVWPPNPDFVHGRLESVIFAAKHELEQSLFFRVAPARIANYNNPYDGWESVTTRFPQLAEDIEEAQKCFALSRPTACVFHLMRVMEVGNQELGSALGVMFPEDKVWFTIADEADKALKKLPRNTVAEKGRCDDLALALVHLNGVRVSWRNKTMHPKETYTLEQAEDLLRHVRTFATHLAGIV